METHQEKSNDPSNYYRGVNRKTMDTITYKTKSLVREMKQHKDYKNYQRLQKKLEENQELLNRVNEYRRRSFLLHNGLDVGNIMQEVRNLRNEYQEELTNPLVMDYLIAEQRVCRMVREVSETIAKDIDLDYGFLEE